MDTQSRYVQWFPGHMAKTRRIMRENLRLVDVVAEIRDARIPLSSRNPEIKALLSGKPGVVLLNKSDMADDDKTRAWCSRLNAGGFPALAVDCRAGKGLGAFPSLVEGAISGLLERRRERGMSGRPIRVMVVGIPNVGKSSFINRLAGGKRTKVEDRPGVTRAKQWVKVPGVSGLGMGMELLDMPGVLWPKFDDAEVGDNLAFTGAIKDDVLDMEWLACKLLDKLKIIYPALLASRYSLDVEEIRELEGYVILEQLGKKRGMLLPGGEVNTGRAAAILLDEFRAGQIGRITLEDPGQDEPNR